MSGDERTWTLSHDADAPDDEPQAFRVTGPEISYGSVVVMPVAAHEAALAAARQVDEAMVERAAGAAWESMRARTHGHHPQFDIGPFGDRAATDRAIWIDDTRAALLAARNAPEPEGERMSLTYADLSPGQTVEFYVFDLQHGMQWERRQVIAVDWPSITLLDPNEDRQYEINATQDLRRRIRDVDEPESTMAEEAAFDRGGDDRARLEAEVERLRDENRKLCDYVNEAAGPVSVLVPVATLAEVTQRAERAEAELAALRQEHADLIAILGEDADGRIDFDAIERDESIDDPCALCGWTLRGHKYVYGTARGLAHLHCSHTLRRVELNEAEAKLARLRDAARAVVDAFDRGRAVQVPDDEPCPELDALRAALASTNESDGSEG